MSTIIDLGKLRFLYRGTYNAATNYELNDVVSYGGNAYVYINRIAGAGTAPSTTSHWSNMVDGLTDQVNYDNSATYQKNDLVKVSGRVYRCLQTTSGNTPPNATYWVLFLDAFKYKGDWDAATAYFINDIVVQSGLSYIATANSTNEEPPNASYWTVFTEGLKVKGVYAAGTTYQLNDLVESGGNVWRCKAKTVGNEMPNATYWDLYIQALNQRGNWTTATVYKKDDTVVHLGQSYRALNNHTAGASFLTDFTGNNHWTRLSSGQYYRGGYADATQYFKNDLVTTGSAPNLNLYMNINDHLSNGTNITDGTEVANWQTIISGQWTTTSTIKHTAFFFGTMN